MNSYIFLTDEGYTFQPETEEEPIVIDSLQMIGTAKGTDAMDAYRIYWPKTRNSRKKGLRRFLLPGGGTVKENGVMIIKERDGIRLISAKATRAERKFYKKQSGEMRLKGDRFTKGA